ncbi:MAG: N-acetylglucosamine-6-phosphate deacetylase [Acidobacteria bacterium]|nr:N-acetylglucosamine-6-phosphate deacetylase [Acidobacteriota bacterium]
MSLTALTARQIFTPLEIIENGLVVVEDKTIRAVGSREELAVPPGARFVDLGDRILAPGFVDLHIHGAAGHDLMEATPEALDAVARLLARHGTTCFLPTTLTAPEAVLLRTVERLGKLFRSWGKDNAPSDEPLATPLGLHLEGPFLSADCRGAHPAASLRKPSLSLFQELDQAAGGFLKVLTLAPELEGALELQAEAVRRGVKVALGHSNATYEQARKAIEAGASHAVHVFNAMRPFAHREPGLLGAILTEDRLPAEVIADGIHVSAPALRLLLRAKGTNSVLLITDGVSATGMGPGLYRLGEMEIEVEPDPQTGALACRNREGKLAGSVLTQDVAIRNTVTFTGVSLCEAVTMASWNPARLLGLEQKGRLRPGADADLVVLEPDGEVAGVMVEGTATFL